MFKTITYRHGHWNCFSDRFEWVLSNLMVSDDDDDKSFLWYGWRTKGFRLISSRDHCQRSSPSRISWHTTSRIWTCAEPEFRLSWMKLCSSDNHYIHHGATLLMLIEIRIAYIVKYNSATPMVMSYLYKFERSTKIFLIQMETIFFYNIFLFVFEQNIIY